MLSAVGIQKSDTSEDEKFRVGFVGEVGLDSSGVRGEHPVQDSSTNESMEVGTSHACLRDHEETDWLIWNSQEWGRAKFKQDVRQVTPRPRQLSKVFESEVKGISGV